MTSCLKYGFRRHLFYIYLLAGLLGAPLLCAEGAASTVDLGVIAIIESSNNPMAYNVRSHAIGLYQITPICLDAYNMAHPDHKIRKEGLFCAKEAYLVAQWYLQIEIPRLLRHYGITDTINNRLWAYNAGIGNVRKHIKPNETQKYIAKYHKLENWLIFALEPNVA